MGSGSSSTRRLTLENEEKANNIIQLSSDVVKRLKECQPEVRSSYIKEAVPFPALPEDQVPIYHYDPRLITSLQSQQEKIVALKKNDEYWEKRLCELEDCHKKIDIVMEGEFNKAVCVT
ncbi:hypothetical protein FQA39_LY11068 [Lamprigera yunnana]|nr:hypothetical protein FQA39_LY11068 [Lamprigera yunnana]